MNDRGESTYSATRRWLIDCLEMGRDEYLLHGAEWTRVDMRRRVRRDVGSSEANQRRHTWLRTAAAPEALETAPSH